MDKEVVLWMFSILVTINSGIVGVLFLMLWGHIRECRTAGESRSAALAELKTQQNRILQDIGTHDTGLRGDVHDLRNLVTPLALWVQTERERR
jgi:hypothetical protein